MRSSLALLLPVAITGLAAPAASIDRTATSEERFAAATAGLVPGEPVDCFDRRRRSSFIAAGDRLIFRINRDTVFVNESRGGCGIVRRDDALVTSSPLGRICRGDPVSFFDPRTGMPGATCTLGQFVPYTRPRGEAR